MEYEDTKKAFRGIHRLIWLGFMALMFIAMATLATVAGVTANKILSTPHVARAMMNGNSTPVGVLPPIPSAKMNGNITWTGPIDDYGNNMTVTGSSLQDIETQIQAIHSGFNMSNNDYGNWDGTPFSAPNTSMGYEVVGLDCNSGGTLAAHRDVIQDGVNYLRGVKGICNAGPGPAACGRISCSWNSGIWWCNDNPEHFSIPCSDLAQYAQDIVNQCSYYCPGCQRNGVVVVRGQEFDAQNFNVLLGIVADGDQC